MASQTIKFDSILGGMSAAQFAFAPGQYLNAVGIDPDLPVSDSVGDRLASALIRPSGYAKFSSSNITGNVVAVITNPKNSTIYTVQSNGKLVSYSSSFGSETLVGTVTGDNADGAFYLNNFIYITGTGSSKDDVSRYGPLDGSPSLTNNVWKGATLGTQVALGTATYPSLRGGGNFPKHWGFSHIDGKAYLLDFDNATSTVTTRGKGLVHAISTKYGSAQGDTNNGTIYAALDLPFDFLPTCGCSYGNDIIIGAVQSSNSTLNQGKAYLFFWDTYSSTYYNAVELPDPLITALVNNNGVPYAFTGPVSNGNDVSNGYRISAYIGGQSFKQIHYSDIGAPPAAGAAEAVGNRIVWGGFTQVRTTTAASPNYYAAVFALNSKNASIPSGVHCIAKATATATAGDGLVTALKSVQQSSLSFPKYAIAWRDSGAFGIDNQSTTYGTWVMQLPKVITGKEYRITKIRIPLAAAIAANMTITPVVLTDEYTTSYGTSAGLPVINSTNFPNSDRGIELFPTVSFKHDFVLELTGTGTALLPVMLPIEVDIEPVAGS